MLTVLDWEGLKTLGEFDPTYLHQRSRERPPELRGFRPLSVP
jgi:hypothetical protein